MPRWSASDIPDLSGRIAVVTGATSGIGYEAALALATRGAEVTLAVRDTARGHACAAKIRNEHAGARLQVAALDLASLTSVRQFAAHANETLPRIDILLNNAGLGLQPSRHVTEDGFEQMFGTNHLGHFALTALLIPSLLQAPHPRVVTIASIAHKRGFIDFNDLQTEHPYSGRKAYGQSKLANLMFALELDKRARAAASRLISVAAHPGVAHTGFVNATKMPGYKTFIGNLGIRLLGNSTAGGAEPGLYAATMPHVQGGQYWGPNGFMEIRGTPTLVQPTKAAQDQTTWSRLWAVSEELTGVSFPSLAAA